ncbi:energy-coupling factor transporter transmembrane protein EcfT [Vagococcus sp. DIV0080]|uniref:Energy-coupling factor transporter transmembrane protein EcfT n=1 Tax=Candidatus Vagococcus giribetii TaxID=2230876 RepID=A0ABS3HW11_9ENTE|nr:energy-coupling factor transporter transmembrane component T [Vagococcus sp. DIV0080]MBO0477530.1 energy-coupling factor transporter transmembrane protein EcfT [Vagococcus sp. DIV0080]
MSQHQMVGYMPGDTFIHRLSGTTKLLAMILISVACMTTYDTRFLLATSIFSLVLFKVSHIKWSDISFIVKFIAVFSILNILAVYLFSPEYGTVIYGSRHVLVEGVGRYSITQEQLFYEFNLILKYISSIPFVLLFLLTTNPSEFASSLNKIGVSYKISYSVALAIRYIPDIQVAYYDISASQQARGYEISKKASIGKRVKGAMQIVFPLILSSLERIEVISTAMELRRFGRDKKRTWYSEKKFTKNDFLVIAFAIVVTLLSFVLIYTNGSRFYNPFQ